MADSHERFEELAVGHVLGGLPSGDAWAFRTHLASCRDCRQRVAELRSIAADLAAAEQDEKRRSPPVTTDVVEQPEETPGAPDGTFRWRPRVGALAALFAVLVVAAGLWGLHQRRVAELYESVVSAQEEVLNLLMAGTELEVVTADAVRGLAAERDGRLAVSLTGIGPLPAGTLLVAWRVVDGEAENPELLGDADVVAAHETIAFVRDVDDADAVLVTIEQAPGQQPSGDEVARVVVRPGSAGD
jgi:anti-sigma factor RsiW